MKNILENSTFASSAKSVPRKKDKRQLPASRTKNIFERSDLEEKPEFVTRTARRWESFETRCIPLGEWKSSILNF